MLDKLHVENEELKDKMLRTVAEMENPAPSHRPRDRRSRTYAVTGFARDLLAVGDNLQRAIQAVPADKRESGSDEFKNLIEGVRTDRAGVAQGARQGRREEVQSRRAKSSTPTLHQAMFEMPNPDMPNNAVAQVVQEGYMIGDRVLRPAMVGVAKGGPKFEDATAENAPEAPNRPCENFWQVGGTQFGFKRFGTSTRIGRAIPQAFPLGRCVMEITSVWSRLPVICVQPNRRRHALPDQTDSTPSVSTEGTRWRRWSDTGGRRSRADIFASVKEFADRARLAVTIVDPTSTTPRSSMPTRRSSI